MYIILDGCEPPGVTAPILIFGWGNPSRGDDALGPLCVAALADLLPQEWQNQIEFLEDYQLQVEHALDMVGRQQVLFIDASLTATAPFEVTQLQAAPETCVTTHAMSPQALMQVYHHLNGQTPPSCTLLAIRGETFELGQPLGVKAQAHLKAALQFAWRWALDAPATPHHFKLHPVQAGAFQNDVVQYKNQIPPTPPMALP
jgi:hydrogenase maturation protease